MRTAMQGIQVLHVDDDPDFANMVAEFVEREDDRLTVNPVSSAAEGLSRLETGGIDCIVSDYDMPGRNGIEFFEAVREEYPELPFILYTGKGSEAVASEAITVGITDYLQKTTSTEQYTLLANRIIASVERYRAQQEVDWQRTIIENMREGVCVFNEAYVLQYLKFRVSDINSISEDDWKGRHLSYLHEIGILSADETARIKDSVDRILNGKTEECWLTIELQLPESVRVINIRLVPVDIGVDEDRVLVTSRDATERHESARNP